MSLFRRGMLQYTYYIILDIFPQTRHVETLVLLSKKKPDSHIEVDVEFGEGEGKISLKDAIKRAEERKPKPKTTYKDIQNYIEENYGFKVHTAYIRRTTASKYTRHISQKSSAI